MDKNKIAERINALLNLASNNSNENERLLAQKQAQKLISKYQISQETLDQEKASKEDPLIEKIIFGGHKCRIIWKERLVGKICKINGCFHVVNNAENPRDGVFYTAWGKTSAIKIVEILIDHIIGQIEWWSKNTPGLSGKSDATSFKLGCVQKICERLEEGKLEAIQESKNEGVSETALVRFTGMITIAEAFARSNGLTTHKVKTRNPKVKVNAYQEGKKAGNFVDLNKPNQKLGEGKLTIIDLQLSE